MKESDIKRLLDSISRQEDQLRSTQFVAPCVRGGLVKAKVAGLVYTFTPDPREFEGWGVFLPLDEKIAGVVEEADLHLITEYLKLLKPVRLRLVHSLHHRTWLAYPVNESDARQRWGQPRPVMVHLVEAAADFEQIIARWDGSAFWFEELDRRADPEIAERMRKALRDVTLPDALQFKGITPEMRAAYNLATQQAPEFQPLVQRKRDEERIKSALRMAGASLQQFHERGDYWIVEWTTSEGELHTSAIARRDLTVISAGICLSGRDRDFDLQSLVGVVERQWE
ncbi:MAG: hypothetical protein AB1631_32810 [Acidobacteriota bacterium]